jgi:hypothetical protein
MTKFIRWLLPRLITSLLTLAIFLGISEWAVRHYVIYSDGLGFTLMYDRWHKKYWHPVNSQGYRDIEWSAEQLAGKTKIIVTGDSFPAGHGTNNVADRFPNVLQQELGDDYAVMLVARQG